MVMRNSAISWDAHRELYEGSQLAGGVAQCAP